jgi:hypothetical protein
MSATHLAFSWRPFFSANAIGMLPDRMIKWDLPLQNLVILAVTLFDNLQDAEQSANGLVTRRWGVQRQTRKLES